MSESESGHPSVISRDQADACSYALLTQNIDSLLHSHAEGRRRILHASTSGYVVFPADDTSLTRVWPQQRSRRRRRRCPHRMPKVRSPPCGLGPRYSPFAFLPQMTRRISSSPPLRCRSVPPLSSLSSPFVMTGSLGHVSRPTSRSELAALQRKDI